jgi:PST family polysaccharide transporter
MLWTVTSFGVNRVVTVATTIILARLLVPSDFGLFVLATLTLNFISIFSGFGLGNALVLGQHLDERSKGTILTLLIGLGIAFAIGVSLTAPLAADLLAQPRVDELLLAVAGILSFGGVSWFYDSVLQRELAFRERFICQLARTVAYAVVALSLAIALDAGVWALMIGFAAGHAANGIALLVLTPYRVRPAWDSAFARTAARTGRGFLVQDAVDFAQQNADYVTIGRLLGTTPLGFYTMAFRQSELPYYALADPVVRVTFPTFAQMRHRDEDTAGPYLSGLGMMALVTFPLGAVLSAAAAPYVETLFGDKWLPMIGALQVLGLWAMARPLEHFVSWYLNSHERAGTVGRVALCLFPALGAAIYLAADRGGIEAVAWVILAHVAISGAILMLLVRRHVGVGVRRQLRVLRGPAAGAVAAWFAARGVTTASTEVAPLASVLAAAAAGLLAYVAVVAVVAPGMISGTFAKLKRAFSRRGAAAATG